MKEDFDLHPGRQEMAITGVLSQRLAREECLRPGDRETISYRVAELMVASKNLYTEVLPRLLEQDGASTYTAFEDLAGMRMALLHMRDLIEDFEEAFLEAMANQREDDGVETEGEGEEW